MDDAEHEQHALVFDHVVHDAMIADSEAVEAVALALDRLRGLSSTARPSPGGAPQRDSDTASRIGRQLAELACGARREANVVGQSSSSDEWSPRS
jgi:hypothetical protein